MKKELIGIFVCMTIIVTVLPVSGNLLEKSTLMSLSSRNIFYVGGSGTGNYTKIQDAIDNTSNGDTVFVFDDSSPYYERVQINKSIDLIGEDRNTTVIDANGGGVVICISSDNVSINEFTLQNSSYGVEFDKNGFNFCAISDNNIIDNGWGIRMSSLGIHNDNIIEGNNFFNNFYWTIVVFGNNNMILGNTIDHSPGTYPGPGVGIDGKGNNISGNMIKNCERGINIFESDNNIVLNNDLSSGYRGICIKYSSNNTIIGNNISYNEYWGVEIRENSNDNIIYHNNLLYNMENAIDEGSNTWDDGKYGNYWSDYKERYPKAKKILFKGIWDTPYEIPDGKNKDNCPLIKKWPKSLSKTSQNNQNIWFHRWSVRFPILQEILDFLGSFYNFYENMKGGM